MPSLSTLAALMLATAVVLAVGCVGSGSGFFGEQKNHPLVTASLNQFPPENTPVHNQTSLHWISIGQTGDMHAGDVFQINATTNLSPGDEILVQVKPSAMFPGGFKVDGMQQTVRVQGLNNTTNIILFDLNTTGYRPDEYLVTEAAVNYEAQDSALFTLYPDAGSPANNNEKTNNFLDVEKRGLPRLQVNNSMPPVAPSGEINLESCGVLSRSKDVICGGIMQFSNDGIVRIYDKEGIQIGAYYDFMKLHTLSVPSGFFVYENGNVKTVYSLWVRIFTVIHDDGY